MKPNQEVLLWCCAYNVPPGFVEFILDPRHATDRSSSGALATVEIVRLIAAEQMTFAFDVSAAARAVMAAVVPAQYQDAVIADHGTKMRLAKLAATRAKAEQVTVEALMIDVALRSIDPPFPCLSMALAHFAPTSRTASMFLSALRAEQEARNEKRAQRDRRLDR